ncbi:MAG: CvpA family protein [Lachnospiraceae bacterium]|nr:CvpA family protein [Lachnospiraceae bacterium]MDD3661412.1 CvpA family protein [Lachnospiraceae bacterium]
MNSINFVLVIVIVIIAAMAVKGYQKGVFDEALSIVALFLGIVGLALTAAVISSYLTGQMSDMMIGVVSLLILIIVAQVARLVIAPLRFVVKMPVLNGLNKLAGFFLGGMEGILCVWILFFLIERFNFGGYAADMLLNIQKNAFLTLLHESNMINLWLNI